MTANAATPSADLARCAEIAAHLAHFPAQNHREIVARFGLRGDDWEALLARTTAARDAELGASSAFVRAFVAAVERLQAQHASMESIGPLPVTFRIGGAPPVVAPLVRTDDAQPTVEVARPRTGAEDLGAPSFWTSNPAASGVSPAPRALAGTVAVSEVAARAMPFVAPSDAPGGAADRALAHAAAVQGARAPSPLGGGTVAVAEPSSASTGELTVEQYASLRVELQLLPEHAAAILARYGILAEERESLFARWRVRFDADPPLRMRFAQAYAQYLAWLRDNPAARDAIAKRPVGGS